ncbi:MULTISPECIES: sulfotransferase [unclassified Vibrio]|jgi:hypothetical protein|uniref:sulfotransferase n=1 Tax=unclassified Vibrio TaxID=2614977 RepID=UPI00354E1EE1
MSAINSNTKYFCIGFNKTGTTSLENAFRLFGFTLGDQATAEMLIFDWNNNQFEKILRFCEMADAFQDIPFSLPGTYKKIFEQYPNAKFILTLRDSAEQWYDSLTRFHTKVFSTDETTLPSKHDLDKSMYRYKGYSLDAMKIMYDYPSVPLYDKKHYIDLYEKHEKDVKEFFKDKPEQLLVLNVAETKSYQKLAAFVGVRVESDDSFPWENKT